MLDGAAAVVLALPGGAALPDAGMTTEDAPAPEGAAARGGGVAPDGDPEPLTGWPGGREPD